MTETMTATQTLNVEYDELMSRADELEVQIQGLPAENPKAPSSLAHATGAAQQLALSSADMRYYMGKAHQEWRILAESLRNAAKAYEEVDEAAAESMTSETSMAAVAVGTTGITDAELEAFMVSATAETGAVVEPLPTYYPVTQAAYDIADPDQGLAFDNIANEWLAYRDALIAAAPRFWPFEYWDGSATDAVEANMEQHRSWLFTMADLCVKIANQARTVAATQRWALPLHPTVEQIKAIEDGWIQYQTDPALQKYWPQTKVEFEMKLAAYQQQSEEILAEYASRASLPLSPAKPSAVPSSVKLPAPTPPPAGGGDEPEDDAPDDQEQFPDIPAEDVPVDETPAEDEWSPSSPSGSAGDTASGLPDTSTDEIAPLTAPPVMPASAMGAGVQPASVGLGRGGSGGGISSMPLQPRMGDVAAPEPSAGRHAAPSGALTGGRAPAGMGGMGMPMGGGQGGQNQSGKTKRAQHTDDVLYKEDRPWTASIIGNRRRNEGADQ